MEGKIPSAYEFQELKTERTAPAKKTIERVNLDPNKSGHL
jgi:hypothetical protein